ncbi:hypothetical protein ACF0H5_018108 [Mactra antiquata]
MNFVFCLLVLLPVALCRSVEVDERFILDTFQKLNLNDVVNALVSALGSDVTESACEAACPSVMGAIPGGSLVAPFLCAPACKEIQHLAQG